jgi:hypothetical protein
MQGWACATMVNHSSFLFFRQEITCWHRRVRATFTTDKQGAWDPRFVTEAGSPTPNAHQPIVHLTPADLVPSLTAGNLKSIDNVLARNRDKAKPEHRDMVLTKNVVNPAQNVPIIPLETGCAGCQKATDRKRLMRCMFPCLQAFPHYILMAPL